MIPAYAEKLAQERGSTFVHPFDDLDIVAGQGSIAMEIVQELPTVDYICASWRRRIDYRCIYTCKNVESKD